MFAIETYVGPKYGNWLTGNERFTTAPQAQLSAQLHRDAEHSCNATRMKRRVISMGGE